MDWINSCFLFLNTGFVQASATPIICDQEYTLCTSARCIPMPGNPAKAVCDCVVEKGKSVGYKTCKERKPIRDRYKVTSLVSTFSFEQFAFKRKMNCSEGLPWTNCLDMPCTVDPQNSKRALCLCTIENTQAFLLLAVIVIRIPVLPAFGLVQPKRIASFFVRH